MFLQIQCFHTWNCRGDSWIFIFNVWDTVWKKSFTEWLWQSIQLVRILHFDPIVFYENMIELAERASEYHTIVNHVFVFFNLVSNMAITFLDLLSDICKSVFLLDGILLFSSLMGTTMLIHSRFDRKHIAIWV